MPGGVNLWKLILVLGGGELLEKTLAPVLRSEQLDFEFTRLPVILAAYSVFLKGGWPHPTYRALMSERNLLAYILLGRSFDGICTKVPLRLAGSFSLPSSSFNIENNSRTRKLERNRRLHRGSPFRIGQAGSRQHGYGKPQVGSRSISHAESRRLRRRKTVGGNSGGLSRSQYGRNESRDY
jgi:hypothetical protein